MCNGISSQVEAHANFFPELFLRIGQRIGNTSFHLPVSSYLVHNTRGFRIGRMVTMAAAKLKRRETSMF
jgi:hypothetical protein